MKAVAGKLAQYKPAHIVIDPVMFAKNGDPLMDPASVGTLIETVLPFAEVLTPNVPEAQYLADMEIRTPEDMEEAARRIYAKGCRNVLVKGGKNIAGAVDVLFDGETCHRIEIEPVSYTHLATPAPTVHWAHSPPASARPTSPQAWRPARRGSRCRAPSSLCSPAS